MGQRGVSQGLQVKGARVLNGRRNWACLVSQSIGLLFENHGFSAVNMGACSNAISQFNRKLVIHLSGNRLSGFADTD